jgi:hypothetical protein
MKYGSSLVVERMATVMTPVSLEYFPVLVVLADLAGVTEDNGYHCSTLQSLED